MNSITKYLKNALGIGNFVGNRLDIVDIELDQIAHFENPRQQIWVDQTIEKINCVVNVKIWNFEYDFSDFGIRFETENHPRK